MKRIEQIIEGLEQDYHLMLDPNFSLENYCDCEACCDEVRDVVGRQLREQEREQILKDIDSYNREYYRNHFTDGTPCGESA